MKQDARVLRFAGDIVVVSVEGNVGPSGPLAACCQIPTVEMEASNPFALDLKPGDLVEVSDGLGKMALAGSSFLVFPAVLFAAACIFFEAIGLAYPFPSLLGGAAALLGLFGAVWFFKQQKFGQYPVVTGQKGFSPPPPSDEAETGVIVGELL